MTPDNGNGNDTIRKDNDELYYMNFIWRVFLYSRSSTQCGYAIYDMSTRNPFEYPCNVAADISPAPAVLSARRRYVNLSEYAIPGRVVLAVSVVPVERRFSWRCTRRVRSSPAAVLLLNVIIHA